MKKFTKFILALIFIGPIIFSGCQKNDILEEENKTKNEFGNLKTTEYCGDVVALDLFEYGYSNDVGQVIIGNDDNGVLHITLESEPGITFVSAGVFTGPVDAIPGSDIANGEGHFSYNDEFQKHEFAYPYPSQDYFQADISNEDNCFAVIVQALVRLEDGSVTNVFGTAPLKVWGYYTEYCKQSCESNSPPLGCPKLAFAHDDESAICFKDIKRNGTLNPDGNGTWANFMLWGWTNGELTSGTYEMDLWAGSQGCDATNGTLVGTVTIEYNGTSADVTYNVDPAYELKSTYLYVGDKILPKKWRRYRVAPLFYPKKHYNVNATTDSFTVNNLSGEIYIAASAIVKDAE